MKCAGVKKIDEEEKDEGGKKKKKKKREKKKKKKKKKKKSSSSFTIWLLQVRCGPRILLKEAGVYRFGLLGQGLQGQQDQQGRYLTPGQDTHHTLQC